MDLTELSELGLSKGQIAIFSALLESGTSGIQHLQEKTGLERRAIYDILNKLIEKGLVSYVEEHNVRKYQCTHPRNLKEAIEQKQTKLGLLHGKLPQITDLFTFSKPGIRAEVYRGNKAMQAFITEALEHDASFWIGGNSGIEQCSEEMNYWFKRWNKKRIAAKHIMHDLVDEGTSLEDYPPQKKSKHKKEYYKYCALPKNLQSPMVIIMFGNKVCQVLWSKQSFGFVIESEEIAQSFMKYFNYFWTDPW